MIRLATGERWDRGKAPGQYVCRGNPPREPWMASIEVTGGYATVTATREALAGVALDVVRAGQACVRSDALAGTTVRAAPAADLAAAPGWAQARASLAAELTPRLAAAAGAVVLLAERPGETTGRSAKSTVAAAIAYAGQDAVRLALARMGPGAPAPDPEVIASQVVPNSVYAVRYAHAAAAAVLRWAGAETIPAGFQPGPLAEPEELALLDALSWLPERVATAARRGRPDVYARYLEDLAARTIEAMSSNRDRLVLAAAARTALKAGLGLLGVRAPDRI